MIIEKNINKKTDICHGCLKSFNVQDLYVININPYQEKLIYCKDCLDKIHYLKKIAKPYKEE